MTMNRIIGRRVSIAVVSAVVIIAGGLMSMKSAHAAAANSIYITPGSNSVQNLGYFTVSVRLNPSTNIDGVDGAVTFDASKLKFVSVDTSSSAFVTEFDNSQNGSTISFSRATSTTGADVTSDALIENITFQALTDSGTTTLGLSGVDDDNAGVSTHPTAGTATVSFSPQPAPAPAPTCAAGQTGTYPHCVTPSSTSTTKTGSTGAAAPGATTTPPAPTPAPVATSTGGLKVPVIGDTNAQYSLCDIAVTTATATQVYVRYGLSSDALAFNSPLSAASTTHNISIDPGTLTPGVKYYYVVVSKDAAGNTSQTGLQSFQLKGLDVTVRVLDQNGKAVANKTVTLHSTPQTGKTDDKGNVTFKGVTPGDHSVIYAASKKTYTQPITVVNNIQTTGSTQTAAIQNFSVKYGFAQSSLSVPLWIWLAVVILVLGAVVALAQAGRLGVALQMRSHKNVVGGAPLVSQPIVIGSNNISDESAAISEKLNAIPNSSSPSPGSVVAPKAGDNTKDKGLGL